MFTRIRFIYALIAFTLLLIILNISLEIFLKPEVKPIPIISKNEIETKFGLTLNKFGISNNWIKKKVVKQKLSDSLNYIFDVSFPKDISIASFIKEINKALINEQVKVETREKVNYGNSVLMIFEDDILKLQANLVLSDKIIREFAEYSFLVKLFFSDEELPWSELSRIFYDFTYLITPSKKSLEIKNQVTNNYAVLLSDEINETDFLLHEDFSKQKLINNIRSIIISFGSDKTYLIDETSDLYKSKIFSFIRDEFNSRNIKLISLQSFPYLIGNTKTEVVSLFNFYTTSLKGKEGKTFVIDYDNFLYLQPAIEKQLKMGDKVVDVK
ncbi:MAG: hypothetical protein COW71_05360 [Ignavibacteriales bacterium CG18_big_fil_WC_8_21_14_2_50_31_20]|nr:MAG: hypothetical protein COW71_05360 [Ignavibacteriales bacterium CG18_big_fil_WC_8_21_14_2_50_31_20]